MRDLFRDPDDVHERIRRRMLRAAPLAVRKLDRVARGQDGFRDDHERSACLALARFGSTMVNAEANAPPMGLGYHRSHTPEQAAELLAKMNERRERRERDGAESKRTGDDDKPVEES